MYSDPHEQFSKKVNAAIRRGGGTRAVAPMSESSRAFNAVLRQQAKRGTIEADIETGEIKYVNGRRVE